MKALRRFKHLDLNFSGEARWGMSLCFTQQKTTFSQLGLRLDHKRSHTNTHTKKRTLKTMLSRWQQTRGCLRPEECFFDPFSQRDRGREESACLSVGFGSDEKRLLFLFAPHYVNKSGCCEGNIQAKPSSKGILSNYSFIGFSLITAARISLKKEKKIGAH